VLTAGRREAAAGGGQPHPFRLHRLPSRVRNPPRRCIALLEAETEILFSGDIVYDGLLADDFCHFNLEDYAASLERLLTFPITVMHGGHSPSFNGTDLDTLIREWLKAHG